MAGHQPLANQSAVPIDTYIHLRVPETLHTKTVENSITIPNTSNNTPLTFWYPLSYSGIISVWPDDYLQALTTYRLRVEDIQDFMGNEMQSYEFEFTTDDGDLVAGTDNNSGSNGGSNDNAPSVRMVASSLKWGSRNRY